MDITKMLIEKIDKNLKHLTDWKAKLIPQLPINNEVWRVEKAEWRGFLGLPLSKDKFIHVPLNSIVYQASIIFNNHTKGYPVSSPDYSSYLITERGEFILKPNLAIVYMLSWMPAKDEEIPLIVKSQIKSIQ